MISTLRLRNLSLPLDRTLIVGILNVTPDSFSDGGKFFDFASAVEHAHRMVAEGADIIDIGGESTRPGSVCISLEEELKRVLPVVTHLLQEADVPISIDTKKPDVAEECLRLGVHMLNDVTGLQDERMVEVAARYRVPTVIMYPSGTAETVHQNPISGSAAIVEDIQRYFAQRAAYAGNAGIKQIIIDPGIGFGKTLEQNLAVMNHLEAFVPLGYPLLVGPSRKGFIGKLLGTDVDDRLEGTLAAVTACILKGARIIRVHDVRACKRAAIMADAIKNEIPSAKHQITNNIK